MGLMGQGVKQLKRPLGLGNFFRVPRSSQQYDRWGSTLEIGGGRSRR